MGKATIAPGNVSIEVPTAARSSLSSLLFRNSSRDYYDCYLAFTPARPSSVPYFLCCRAIELELKARLMELGKNRKEAKSLGHGISKCYSMLPAMQKTLSKQEILVLRVASRIYEGKGFEYVALKDPGFKRFPNLNELAAVAAKLVT